MKIITATRALIVLATAGSLFFSCKKDKTVTQDCSVTMANLSGTYKLTALKYKLQPNSTEVDYLAFMDACEKDDIIILQQNGTYNYQDAGTQCAPNGSGNGTWALNGNIINSDGVISGTVASYDCHTLIYYTENVNTAGDRVTFTMVKQ